MADLTSVPPAGSLAGASKDPIPGEFKYWEQLDTPYAKALRQLLKAVFGVEPKLPDAAVRKYAEAYYDADPVAEAFIDEVGGESILWLVRVTDLVVAQLELHGAP